MLGGSKDTNIQDAFQTAGFNQTSRGVVMEKNPGWETVNTSLPLETLPGIVCFGRVGGLLMLTRTGLLREGLFK